MSKYMILMRIDVGGGEWTPARVSKAKHEFGILFNGLSNAPDDVATLFERRRDAASAIQRSAAWWEAHRCKHKLRKSKACAEKFRIVRLVAGT